MSLFFRAVVVTATLAATIAWSRVSPAADAADTPLTLVAGDRIVLIGDVLVEREQASGWWETALVSAFPDLNLKVRNLGWSGDTVLGLSRAGFGGPPDGFNELTKMIREVRPTVVVIGYGMSHSFDGEAGLPNFKRSFDELVKMLEAGDPKPRLLILSPIKHESYVLPSAAISAHNAQLELYTKTLREEANTRGATFVDLFNMGDRLRKTITRPLTDNGIHLTSYGYWATAPAFVAGFGRTFEEKTPSLRLKVADGKAEVLPSTPTTGKFDSVKLDKNVVTLKGTLSYLPRATAPNGKPDAAFAAFVTNGKEGENPTPPVLVSGAADLAQVEALREEILHKNSLFFHRWRPENWTYLFGFRKHEQGNNSVEIPQFDPLIEEVEKKIAGLRTPHEQTYEITLPTAK